MNAKEGLPRSTVFYVKAPDDMHRTVVESIRHYRACLRKLFTGAAMAQMAGAAITFKGDDINIKPDNAGADEILAKAFGGKTSNLFYGLRSYALTELAPTWMSNTWDDARRNLEIKWKAKDPELTKASRGWLLLQGARGLCRFNRIGIGIPAVRLGKNAIQNHKLTLRWDNDIGPVEFTVLPLDGGRYQVWRALRDGQEGWKIGTLYLNEHDGKLRVTVSYHCPEKSAELDKARALSVAVTEDADAFLAMSCADARWGGDRISAHEAIGWLRELDTKRQRFEQRRESCGSPRKKWGNKGLYRAVCRRLNTVSRTRENGVKTRNHLWTRRIVEHAIRQRCGTIVVSGVPEREMFGHPWQWAQFRAFLDYKAREIGATVSYD